MSGFPTELRPLLALVIMLAIAHMLLKARARRAGARAPRPRRSRTRAALGATRGVDASIESRSAAPSPNQVVRPPHARAPATRFEAGGGAIETDPAEALRLLRMHATNFRAPSDASKA